jgi:hypothetical protein
VWLASISKFQGLGHERSHPASTWNEATLRRADQVLDAVLDGVGDAAVERSFSMCLTHCRHRALTDAEVSALPRDWREACAIDIAGGPVRVHWTKGIEPVLSAEPCEHMTFDESVPGLKFPVDCGACAPCRARAFVMRTGTPCRLSREELVR